jgi:DNA-binding CsgD family transcriptional regulator
MGGNGIPCSLYPGCPCIQLGSDRLRQVLHCLFSRDSEKQSATRLGLARSTFHQYVTAIYRFFDVHSRPELLSRFWPRARRPDAPVDDAALLMALCGTDETATSNQLAEILRTCRSHRDPDEARRAHRIEIWRRATLIINHDSPPMRLEARLCNCSRMGIGIITAHPLRPASTLAVLLRLPSGQDPRITCIIRHSCPLGPGTYRAGAEFRAPDSG